MDVERESGQGRQRAGRKQGGQGIGRGGRFAAGPGGVCACPDCGYQQPHERGVPCPQVKCPQCGRAMLRA
ncbi:MAG: hypothetical protein ACLFQ9_05795 [Desulfobacterales bacterium]